jgi:hypothetical protein
VATTPFSRFKRDCPPLTRGRTASATLTPSTRFRRSGGLLAIVGFLAVPDSLVALLAAVTIAAPVIAAAWAFLRGGRFGRCK